MTLLLPTLAAAFAAFCVWLAVRVVNRRERWAKWTLAAVVGIPVLYVAGFGPACWLVDRDKVRIRRVCSIYRPIFAAIEDGPESVSSVFWWYLKSGCSKTEQTVSRFMVATGMADLSGPGHPGDFDE